MMDGDPKTVKQGGFSLVELVLVLVIVGVIGAIAMPRFAQANARQQLQSAAARLQHDIQAARQLAQATTNRVTVSFNPAASSYTYQLVGETATKASLDEAPYGVSIASASFNNESSFSFNGYGVPSASGQVVLKSSAGSAVLTLAANGEVTR